MEIGFHHGALCEDYEIQANRQGFTFGDSAEFVQKLGFGLVACYVHGILTESEYQKALKRFNAYLIKNLIEKDGDVKNETNI